MEILFFGRGGTSRETIVKARLFGDSCSLVIRWACRSGTALASDLFSTCRVWTGDASSSREFCILRH
jgi:hypothetical protein